MNIIELKKSLIDKIQATKSNELLEEINRFLNSQDPDSVEVYQLNEEQQNAISEAREDIKNGHYSSDEEVNEEFKQWLKK